MAPFIPGKGPAATPDGTPTPIRRSTRRRTALISFAVLGAFVVLAVVWVGVRGAIAATALQRTQETVAQIRSDPDPATLADRLDSVVVDTSTARSMTSDPVWRLTEGLPLIGANTAAVRQLADVSGRLGEDVVAPAAAALRESEATLTPKDGRIDIEGVGRIADSVVAASQALPDIRTELAGIDTSATLGQLGRAKETLTTGLDQIAGPLSQAGEAARLLPAMLGADGPRNYLLMFANNAEARPLEGNPASLALVTVADGKVAITDHASSRDFPRGGEPPLQLPAEATAAYDPNYPRYIMDVTTRPDFPTAARLASAYWKQRTGVDVDGVALIDPVVMGGMLDGADPIELEDGLRLTSANAVQLLLSDVYTLYPADPSAAVYDAAQNAFFARVTDSTFSALTGGRLRPEAVARAVANGVEEGRVMFWSARDDEQAVVAETPVSGILPVDNSDQTTLGVYLSNMSSNKMDFFTGLSVEASAACTDGRAVYEASYTIESGLTQEQADTLPAYQAGGWWGTSQYRTDSYAVGPVGARYLDSTVSAGGNDTQLLSVVDDLGRPVVRLTSYYPPGAEIRVTVRFEMDGPGGPLEVRSTPLVKPTTVTIKDGCAG